MPILLFTEGPLSGRRIRVSAQLVLGRAEGDLHIDDPEVSRRHAAVRPVVGGLEIEDLGSTNGTWVNGTRVDGVGRLLPGDVLRVGGASMQVEDDADITVFATTPSLRGELSEAVASEPGPAQPETAAPEAVAAATPAPVPFGTLAPRAARQRPPRRRKVATRTFWATFLAIAIIVATAVAIVAYYVWPR